MYAILLFCLGFIMFWFPMPLDRKSKRHLERLEELEAGAEEALLDEHRTLKANALMAKPRRIRMIGTTLLIGGMIKYYSVFS